MRYSLIRKMDVSNGEGIGISLFVQGCHFHCRGCFNQETWDFNGGKEWTKEIENKFVMLANKPYIKRISILGGEPLADENIFEVRNLIQKLKLIYPNKKIWLYTGYTWEEIIQTQAYQDYDLARTIVVSLVDVLCEGRFQLSKQDLYNKEIMWVGSTNQRVIDIQKSLAQNKIILY